MFWFPFWLPIPGALFPAVPLGYWIFRVGYWILDILLRLFILTPDSLSFGLRTKPALGFLPSFLHSRSDPDGISYRIQALCRQHLRRSVSIPGKVIIEILSRCWKKWKSIPAQTGSNNPCPTPLQAADAVSGRKLRQPRLRIEYWTMIPS